MLGRQGLINGMFCDKAGLCDAGLCFAIRIAFGIQLARIQSMEMGTMLSSPRQPLHLSRLLKIRMLSQTSVMMRERWDDKD
jgi:hypothetical protein